MILRCYRNYTVSWMNIKLRAQRGCLPTQLKMVHIERKFTKRKTEAQNKFDWFFAKQNRKAKMFPFRCQFYKLCLFVILVTVIISCILLWWNIKATVPQKSNGKRFSSHVTALKRLRLTLETLKKSLTCMTSSPNASDINSMVGLSVTAGE